jgi:AraC-like DNA-binding protein
MRAPSKIAPTTSVRLVWPFLALSRKHGYDVSGIADRLGLTAAQLDDPDTRVPQAAVARLLHEAIELSGERDIGLLAARFVDSQHFGITEYLARTRPTLGAVLADTERFLPLLGDGAGFTVERRGRRAVVRFWLSPELSTHEAAYEFAIAIAVLRARRLTGKADLAPIEISFMHARPESTRRHEKLFLCSLRFGAEATEIVMSERAMQVPLASAEPALGALLERQATQMLEHLPRGDDLASRVEALLGGAISLRTASAERAARRLGMSVRTLTRRLAEEGTSYRALIDQARAKAAQHELTQTDRTLTEIADRLGFATSQSFHRAFKRWTGTTADAVRKGARSRTRKKPTKKKPR